MPINHDRRGQANLKRSTRERKSSSWRQVPYFPGQNMYQFLKDTSPTIEWSHIQWTPIHSPTNLQKNQINHPSISNHADDDASCQSQSKSQSQRYAKLGQKTLAFDYNLRDLWSFYDQPYGHECFFSFKGKETQVYYIPYLSAIQLFVHDSDLQAELLLNSNNLPNNLPKDHQNSEETATSNCSSSPVFEFYETSSPNERIPLVDKMEILAEQCQFLKQAKMSQLDLEKSWFAISWYPLVLDFQTRQELCGCFLTYHCFDVVGLCSFRPSFIAKNSIHSSDNDHETHTTHRFNDAQMFNYSTTHDAKNNLKDDTDDIPQDSVFYKARCHVRKGSIFPLSTISHQPNFALNEHIVSLAGQPSPSTAPIFPSPSLSCPVTSSSSLLLSSSCKHDCPSSFIQEKEKILRCGAEKLDRSDDVQARTGLNEQTERKEHKAIEEEKLECEYCSLKSCEAVWRCYHSRREVRRDMNRRFNMEQTIREGGSLGLIGYVAHRVKLDTWFCTQMPSYLNNKAPHQAFQVKPLGKTNQANLLSNSCSTASSYLVPTTDLPSEIPTSELGDISAIPSTDNDTKISKEIKDESDHLNDNTDRTSHFAKYEKKTPRTSSSFSDIHNPNNIRNIKVSFGLKGKVSHTDLLPGLRANLAQQRVIHPDLMHTLRAISSSNISQGISMAH